MRNMSFMLTTPQMKAKTKTVTRRSGWAKLKVGEIVMACEKCQGLGKGGKIVRIGPIRILSNEETVLDSITDEDVAKEGFPEWNSNQFILFFCTHNKCNPDKIVRRIEFEYV